MSNVRSSEVYDRKNPKNKSLEEGRDELYRKWGLPLPLKKTKHQDRPVPHEQKVNIV